MEVKEILKNLREKNNLTQEQMAQRVNITRQAISRWETGETQPDTQMLKVLSKEFDVFDKYSARFSTTALLSVLWNAS